MIYTQEKIDELVKAKKAEVITANIRYARHGTQDAIGSVYATLDTTLKVCDHDKKTIYDGNTIRIDGGQLRAMISAKGDMVAKYVAARTTIANSNEVLSNVLDGITITVIRHNIKKDEPYELASGKSIVRDYDWIVTGLLEVKMHKRQKALTAHADKDASPELKKWAEDVLYGNYD